MAIAVQNAPDDMVYVRGLSLTRLDTHTGTAKFDVTHDADRARRPLARRAWNTARISFEAETMARLARHYVRVLEEAVGAAGPSR